MLFCLSFNFDFSVAISLISHGCFVLFCLSFNFDFSVAISLISHGCFILVLILISVLLFL